MAVMEPLPRKNSASCAVAIFRARTFNVLSDSGIQPGGAGAKYCAPTFNVLSDSEVRRDYMAEACTYLPYDAIVFCGRRVFFWTKAALFSLHATKAGNHIRF